MWENGFKLYNKQLFTCNMDPPRPLLLRCSATKGNGCLCKAIIGATEFRCGIHRKVLEKKGSRQFVYDEIIYRRKRMISLWHNLFIHPDELQILSRAIWSWKRIALLTFQNMTDAAITELLHMRGAWYIRGHPEPISEEGLIAVALLPPPAPIRRQTQTTELGRFASDKQNVHLKTTVNQTTKIVKKVLAIPVPDEYRWNTQTLSKTPGEIISSCKLTPKAGAVMTDKYSHDDDVYELGRGIYGKVLDSVWQYISKSTDKESLCVILKQELQDNIGMCAQGNLSRLCNALAGYIDDVGNVESTSEKLGRMIPLLMNIEDVGERIKKVKQLLDEVKLPTDEWDNWLVACY